MHAHFPESQDVPEAHPVEDITQAGLISIHHFSGPFLTSSTQSEIAALKISEPILVLPSV